MADLLFAHRGTQKIDNRTLSFSSHGDFVDYFFKGDCEAMSKIQFFEFFEMVLTRIVIIDNRIFNLLKTKNDLKAEYSNGNGFKRNKNTHLYKLKNKLLLEVYPESSQLKQTVPGIDFSFDKYIMQAYNFVVIHLSYIENILGYREENIKRFIDEMIIKKDEEIPTNFILVITTARGRSEWWEKLVNSPEWETYRKFVTFRPIESIINAVSDGHALNDDFQIKINLTRVLFGS